MMTSGNRDRISAPLPGTLAVLGLVLAAVLVQFGMRVVMVAGKGDLRDFAAGYTAAVVARTGASFYDPQPGKAWFAENVNADLAAAARQAGTLHQHPGFEHVHIFSYPPAMMFVFLPFSAVSFPAAKLIWLVLSLLMIGWALWLLVRWFAFERLTVFGLLFLAAIFHPLRNTVDIGQVNALIFLGMTGFWVLYRQGHDVAAGVVLGMTTAIRLHPGLLVLYLLWRRQFRVGGVALAAACAMSAGATGVFGLRDSAIYFEQVAPKFAVPLISVENHSLAGFLATVAHACGWGLSGQVVGPSWLAWGAALVVIGVTLLIVSRGRQTPGSGRLSDIDLALLLAAIPLATPNTTVCHLLVLLPCIGILLDRMVRQTGSREVLWPVLTGLAVILIGVVDDFYVHPLLSGGPLIFLAEIKFYGVVLLYAALARQVMSLQRSPHA
jgi:glycosyl transferase family 87